MVLSNPFDAELLRLRIVLVAFLATLVLLGGALWRVQVLQASEHSQRLDRQSIRRVRLPGLRGEITDRHGETLAANRPSSSTPWPRVSASEVTAVMALPMLCSTEVLISATPAWKAAKRSG